MRVSVTKFVIIFVVSAFVFQFIMNSLLGPQVRLFPVDGDWFPGSESPVAWKSILSAILYPVKLILLGPLALFFKVPDPDPVPPVMAVAFTLYWTTIAVILYYFIKLTTRKRA